MLRVRGDRLSVTGGSRLLGGSTGDQYSPFLCDCSGLEKPNPTPGQDAPADSLGSDRILAASFSPSGRHFALTDDRKRLVLFRTEPDWERVSVRWVSRRCTALTFSACGNHILVADKSGDIFSFSVTRAQEEGHLELGHLSMLLDVAVSLDGKHLITCDRDEKIRVSLWESPHVVSSFCLGHTEFVSQLLILPGSLKLLLSGSGDGTLRLWEYETGREVQSLHLGAIQRSQDSEDRERFAVSRISCCPRGESVAVLSNSVPGIFLFRVSAGPCLEHTQTIPFPRAPWDVDFDGSAHLWVLSGVQEDPLVQYRQTDGCWQVVPQDETLNKLSGLVRQHWKELEGSVESENRFCGLYKVFFDNMATYLRKKEVRLEKLKHKVTLDQGESPSKLQKTE
ncbi:tRNA (guanine-N(7)-)-methyltransferase non-catalytic subunit WDR4 isoform 1-T1 [Rhinophrynus dorsalis]